MSSYLNVDGPDEILRAGQKIAEIGERTRERGQALKARIAEVAATQPWGDDMFGEAFLEQYHQVPEDGHTPFNEAVDEGLASAGRDVKRLGDSTVSAMVTFEAQDVLGGHIIAKDLEV